MTVLGMKQERVMEKNFLTVQELADRLGVKRQTVQSWIDQGALYAKKAGPLKRSPWRIPMDEAERFIKRYAISENGRR